jgi:hypothetical protein
MEAKKSGEAHGSTFSNLDRVGLASRISDTRKSRPIITLTGFDWLGLGLTHPEAYEGLSAAGPQSNDDLTTDNTDKFLFSGGIGEIRGGESPRR